jgi:hypothetical protein
MNKGACHPAPDNQQYSQQNAEAAPERLGPLQRETIAAIRDAQCGGRTAFEAASVTGHDRHSIQPRITELQRKGLVVASGRRRPNPSGKTAMVWIAREYAVTTNLLPHLKTRAR